MPAPHTQADVVVGIVAADAGADASRAVREVEAGMAAYFPPYSWIATQARPRGVWTKTKAYRSILELVRRKRAACCLIVDAGQQGFESHWVDSLLRPCIHSGYDLVTPIYNCCAREHPLSGNLLSPILGALFGIAPKHPMSGDLVISARLADRLLARRDWNSTAAQSAPSLWVAFIAAAERYRMAESIVGPSALQPTGLRLPHRAVFESIAGSLFKLMDQYEGRWSTPSRAMEMDRFGQPSPVPRESARIGGLECLARFVEASAALRAPWRAILDPQTFAEVEKFQVSLRNGDADRFLPDPVWVRIVYEIAAAWKHRVLPRNQVLGLFNPLFLARAGAFLMKTQWREQDDVEAELQQLAGCFVSLRPVLDRLWTGEIANTVPDPGTRDSEAA